MKPLVERVLADQPLQLGRQAGVLTQLQPGFAALLAKQLGIQHEGWREEIGPYAEDGSYRSVADVVDAESLQKVRAFKKEQKAAAKAVG